METVETRVGSTVDFDLVGRDDFFDLAAQFAETRVDACAADRFVGRLACGFEKRIKLRVERHRERAVDDVPCITLPSWLYRSLPSRSPASPRRGTGEPWNRLGSACSAPRRDLERRLWGTPFPPKSDGSEEKGNRGTVLADQKTHLVFEIAADVPVAHAGTDLRLHVAANFLVHLAGLAKGRFDFMEVGVREAFFRF